MLILQRNKGEMINVGDDIQILVTNIRPWCVSLGITAPKHISIWRNEVYQAIKREQQNQPAISCYRMV